MFPPFLALLRHVRPNICTEIQCKAEASHTSIDQTVESQYFHICTICIFSFICACWLGLRCAHIHTDRQMASCAFFYLGVLIVRHSYRQVNTALNQNLMATSVVSLANYCRALFTLLQDNGVPAFDEQLRSGVNSNGTSAVKIWEHCF